MKPTVIEFPDDLVEGLRRYACGEDPHRDVATVAQQAIRQFLASHGLLVLLPGLRITAAERGSGRSNLSLNHDRYFTE
ncbi:MAG: hypothetical protein QOJ59_4441 [Thermomicrobiales bacterium]|jgi:hypothetical protein|nr:hypothetical protein [Thermomicrobiales bacterium]